MRAHIIAHRLGVVLSSMFAILMAASYAALRSELIENAWIYLGMIALGVGFAIYALCRAIGWIMAGFSTP